MGLLSFLPFMGSSKTVDDHDDCECSGEGPDCACDDGEKAAKKAKGLFGLLKGALKPPTVGGGVGGLGAGSPCDCRGLFVIPLPDPNQITDLIAKGEIPEQPSEDETKKSESDALTEADAVEFAKIYSGCADPAAAMELFVQAKGGKKKKTKSTKKPWQKGWIGSGGEWKTAMQAELQKVTTDRQLFDRYFAMMEVTKDTDGFITKTARYVEAGEITPELPKCCFFGPLAEAEEDQLLLMGDPMLTRHREFDAKILPGQGPVGTAFPGQDGSKYSKNNLAMVMRPYIGHDEVIVMRDYVLVRTLNRTTNPPTNQYTVLSYDTFRLAEYGCEAICDDEKQCCQCNCLNDNCYKITKHCSYKGQCCKYNPKVAMADMTPDLIGLHGLIGCQRKFLCGLCDCAPPNPEGVHRIEFRQYPDTHTKANRHKFCCVECTCCMKFTEHVKGKLVIEAKGLAAKEARDTVAAIHKAQKAWLARMDYPIPAAKAFTVFQASSTCGTLLVLDAADACFTVYGGNTDVVWAGGERGERSVDYINWAKQGGGGRNFEMSRVDCNVSDKPAVTPAGMRECNKYYDGVREREWEGTGSAKAPEALKIGVESKKVVADMGAMM